MLCGSGVKAGMACSQVKLYVAIHERFEKGALQMSMFIYFAFYFIHADAGASKSIFRFILVHVLVSSSLMLVYFVANIALGPDLQKIL